MYVTCGDPCYRISFDEVTQEDGHRISQEEVDTMIIMHAKHAAPPMPSISTIAGDSDIIVMCLAFQQDISCDIHVKCETVICTW